MFSALSLESRACVSQAAEIPSETNRHWLINHEGFIAQWTNDDILAKSNGASDACRDVSDGQTTKMGLTFLQKDTYYFSDIIYMGIQVEENLFSLDYF